MTLATLARLLLVVAALLPGLAAAGDAETFSTANRTAQAELLQNWTLSPNPSRLPLLNALKQETQVTDGLSAFNQTDAGLAPLGDEAQPQGETKKLRLTNRLRVLVAGALASPQANVRLDAVKLLSQSTDPETEALLKPLTDASAEPNTEVRQAATEGLRKIEHRQKFGEILGQAFMGLDLGSILLLAALGLARSGRVPAVFSGVAGVLSGSRAAGGFCRHRRDRHGA